ncbi:MFS transporter [Phenylobacterium sp. SCN 70-31]|uniref:spinster family MFS transporter n=1 Tax=Phenylobacterium sp. SCN 70-31 TaxID=1660129 RepID=UPI0025F6396F|nr:MFS transporter [Phenylobacterium sp. SCN 70-31]
MAKGAYGALAVLFLINVVNYTDRQILSILMEPIRQDLGLNDTQLGLLSGLAFALFYAVMGIPIARAADRFSRRNIIALALFAWSGLTALCGFAQSFGQLMLARIGVAVGEAGSAPPSHSILADLFPHGRRSTALAVLSAGAPLGVLFGLAIGGIVNELFNWRVAFIVAGAPGLVLMVVLLLFVREPVREGTSAAPADPPAEGGRSAASTLSVLARLWAIPSFRALSYAAALQAFTAYGVTQWSPTFFIRTFGVGTAQLGLSLGLMGGLAAAIGTIVFGNLADRLGRRDPRWFAWLPAITVALCVPFNAAVFFAPSFPLALVALVIPSLLSNAFAAPTYATIQSIVPPQMRSTASAFLLLIMAVIGMGLGPQAIGLLSDAFKAAAGADSLRWAMTALLVVQAAAAWRFLAAARNLGTDLEKAGVR